MFEILEGGIAPTKETKYSAGIDLYAREDVIIGAGETVKVPLGIKIDLLSLEGLASTYLDESKGLAYEIFCKEHYLELHPASELRAKGLIVGVEIINLDFKDEIEMIVRGKEDGSKYNFIDNELTVKKGTKVAQVLLKEHKSYLLGVDSNEENK